MELAYGKKELEQIAKLYGIKGAYKLKKAELIEILQEEIPKKLPEMLPMLDQRDLDLFEQLLKMDKVIAEGEKLDPYYNLMELELAQYIQTSESNKLCVSGVIKSAYGNIDLEALRPTIERNSQLREYVISILNLYGVVEISWAVELFNKYYEPKITASEISSFVKKDMRLSCQSKIMEQYIVEETIYALDKSNFKEFVKATVDKNYFTPSKELLEKVNDEVYYEPNLYIERLKSFLMKTYSISEPKVEELMTAITMIARVDCDRTGKSMEFIIDEIVEAGIEIDSISEMNAILKYMTPVINHTRKWINKGFTSAELTPHIVDTQTGQKVKVLDIGRNAPCPCGSGKKYKKCCGK